MRIVHSKIKTVGEKPKKKVPLYKDKVFMAELVKQIIRTENAKILKARSK